ncbi:hypothetical protein SteCoe_7563 [Stentor coeruleus]|uniref:Transmembrane protein n=1 Tax=Stentor coeruleus TaxID=5963 RepID=A0A1R2CMC2_9CILI|nr:hypothetical protein SteCoe_7563 [Stentor coeruleus]
MNSLYSITKSLQAKAQKLEKFTNTYLRCFEKQDIDKIVRKNHIGKLIFTIITGPFPAVGAWYFPYEMIYPGFSEVPIAYSMPVYGVTFIVIREVFGQINFRSQLRFKQKMYEKYQPVVDLTKEQIEEIEYEEKQRLKIASSEPPQNNNK